MNDIVISELSKSFGEHVVLKDFNAVFKAGELSCIMGVSGGGKTTLLNILLGLMRQDGGEINGLPKEISCVFQEDRLCEDFSAVTNVRIACDKNITAEEIESQLKEVGLGDSMYRTVRELSGGMKRRVAIVRALMAPGELIIMDEPFVGLDPKAAHILKQMMREMCDDGGAIFFSTHILEVAEKLCDKVAIIKDGKLVKSGTMEEVKGDESLESVFLESEE